MIDIHAIMERCGCIERGCQVRIQSDEWAQSIHHESRGNDSPSLWAVISVLDGDQHVIDAIADCHQVFDAGTHPAETEWRN